MKLAPNDVFARTALAIHELSVRHPERARPLLESIRGRVRDWNDLEPALIGRVEKVWGRRELPPPPEITVSATGSAMKREYASPMLRAVSSTAVATTTTRVGIPSVCDSTVRITAQP